MIRRALSFAVLLPVIALASESPRGFFVEDLRVTPPVPAFYDIERSTITPFTFRQKYDRFIEMAWDRAHGRVFFSARLTPQDPYRVYMKPWPDGEETSIYENPLGPFRFLLSPNSDQLVVQVMGPSAWPILAVHDWGRNLTTLLGQGFSPDWSEDGLHLLYIQIPGALPGYLTEYSVELTTSTRILDTPVAEAVYAGGAERVILKTLAQAKSCDEFQMWNRAHGTLLPFSTARSGKKDRHCSTQREVNAFPGHEYFYFKESDTATDYSDQTVVVADVEGSRLQTIPNENWSPKITAVEAGTLVIGEDPLYVTGVDGAGGAAPIPKARFIKYQR